jgi:hypothetical protein
LVCLAALAAAGQTPAAGQIPTPGQFPPYSPPRAADGKPNLNGVWQALGTADWDIEAHQAKAGPYTELLGAYIAEPGGQGIVEGGTIPYQPSALARKKQNFEKRTTASVPGDGTDPPTGDPELKCFMPGVPRAMYMPYPFQIVQTPEFVLLTHEFNGSSRIIRMNWKEESPLENSFFMGWSRGRWEGDTLVVDVTGLSGQNWLDRAGNFHSDAVHVVERFTLSSPYHIMYEATIEDPQVYTRPWKISFPLYRRMERNVQLMEFKCVPFVEELLYGRFTKKP